MNNHKKFGFIGGGKMAEAIIAGMIRHRIAKPKNICVFDIKTEKSVRLQKNYNIAAFPRIEELTAFSEFVFIAVKPGDIKSVLEGIKKNIGQIPVISIAAGWHPEKIKSILGKSAKILRIMPNTPLIAGEGMTVFETPSGLDNDEISLVEKIFSSMGRIERLPSCMMDAATAVSGSGPAYVYMFIDALADAGVHQGLSRETALKLAVQTVLGAAKTVIQSEKRPEQLKNDVCSPGGTTIEAVKMLEEKAFRETIIEAVKKCAEKSQKLSK